jgi:hypothetical protein
MISRQIFICTLAGGLLAAPLAAALVRDGAPELRLVRAWLDSWSSIGLIVAGMTHQGWDVQLTAYAARDWRANFFPVGIAHSIVGGSAWEPTPWRAVQRAAWETLFRDTVGGEDLIWPARMRRVPRLRWRFAPSNTRF